MSERIVAAAITIYGVVASLPPPARHGDIAQRLTDLRPDIATTPRAQGFFTSTGRFVGRREAAQIAVAAGQIDKPQHPPELFTEDLW